MEYNSAAGLMPRSQTVQTAVTVVAPQVCLEYVPAFGGSVISVTDFAHALDSRIITFISERTLSRIPGRDPRVTYIPVRDDKIGKTYSWTNSHEKELAKREIQKADLIVCHLLYRYHVEWAVKIARKAGVPYWIVPHGGLDPYVFTYRALQKRLWLKVKGRRILRHAAAVIFATRRERDKASRYVNHSRCKVIHWAVEAIPSTDENAARAKLRARYGIPADHKVLLFMGRLHELKRPLELIRLMALLADPALHLLVVGPDETISQNDCRELAIKLGARNVHVIGPSYGTDRYDFFFAADAYISLSHRENFGFTVAEALACGCPVILGPGNDLGEEIRGVGCGWILPVGSLEVELAGIREFASESRSTLQAMGARGRSWARDHLSYERFDEKVRELALETIALKQ